MKVYRYLMLGVAASGVVRAASIQAQESPRSSSDMGRLAIHTLLGGYAPLGARRDVFGPAFVIGGQVATRLGRGWAAVATLASAQGDDRTHANDNAVTLIQYDAGLERRWCPFCSNGMPVASFLGAGFGGRDFRHDRGARPAQTSATAYVATGLELRRGRVGVRGEVRDYWSRTPRAGGRAAGGDFIADIGLAYHFLDIGGRGI